MPGRLKQGEGQQVCGYAKGRLVQVGQLGQRAQVVNHAVGGRVLGQRAEKIAPGHQARQGLPGAGHFDGDAQRPSPGLNDLDGLRMAITGHQEDRALAFDAALGQGHGLGSSCGLVEHGGIGNGHATQVADHGLEVDQRLHAALRNFSLVGRVGGVPGGVLQDVAKDHRGRVRAVVALADIALEDLVAACHGFELGQRLRLRNARLNGHVGAARNRARHHRFNEGAARSLSYGAEHPGLVGGRDANVARNEFLGIFKLAQRLGGRHQHGRAPAVDDAIFARLEGCSGRSAGQAGVGRFIEQAFDLGWL